MDSDSTISAIVLGLSLATLMIVWPIEASFNALGSQGIRALAARESTLKAILESLIRLPLGASAGLTTIRALILSAAVASTGFLLVKQDGAGWLIIGLTGLGFVSFIGVAYALSETLGRTYGERIVAGSAATVLRISWPFYPLIWLQQKAIDVLVASRGGPENAESETELSGVPLALTTDGELLDETERRMIRGVIRLDDTPAREIMVPRVDMVAAEMGIPIPDLADMMLTAGHSRIPVYEESPDHILGVAYARDVLQRFNQGERTTTVGPDVVRPVLFIPESKNLEELLEEFKSSRVHMAIVVDEYGGVSGLVTIEDLLEEIVGEILDEFDVDRPEIRPLSETEFLLDAGVGIDDLQDLVGVTVQGNGFDTLGGLVFERLGKIPSPGDTVEEDGVRIRVISTEGRRPKTLRVTKALAVKPGE